MAVDEIADRLHPRPAGRRMSEQPPGFLRQTIGFAIAAAEQKLHHIVRQIRDLVLDGVQVDRVEGAGIVDHRIGMAN